ncbi:MAG: hypothetical protein IPP19_03870 [Verrucomicrobia bacterium]|nr:hypothetical protein [Verrucomicrobiota bacterium]
MPTKYTPIWLPDKLTHAGNRWFSFSPKAGRDTALANLLHFERSIQLDWSPNVESFCEYPKEIERWVDSVHVRARLHFWVQTKDGAERFERLAYDKPERTVEEIRADEACRRWCADEGHQFSCVKQQEVRADLQFLANARYLRGFYDERTYVSRRADVAAASLMAINHCEQFGPTKFQHLFEKISGRISAASARLGIIDLLREGRLTAQLSKLPFDSGTFLKAK